MNWLKALLLGTALGLTAATPLGLQAGKISAFGYEFNENVSGILTHQGWMLVTHVYDQKKGAVVDTNFSNRRDLIFLSRSRRANEYLLMGSARSDAVYDDEGHRSVVYHYELDCARKMCRLTHLETYKEPLANGAADTVRWLRRPWEKPAADTPVEMGLVLVCRSSQAKATELR